MASLNVVILSGTIAEEPRSAFTQNGMQRVEVILSTLKEGYGDRPPEREDHCVTFWGKRAAQFLDAGWSVGNAIIVRGRLSSRKVETRQGGKFLNENFTGESWSNPAE